MKRELTLNDLAMIVLCSLILLSWFIFLGMSYFPKELITITEIQAKELNPIVIP